MQIVIRIERIYFGTDIKIDNSWFGKNAAQIARHLLKPGDPLKIGVPSCKKKEFLS